MRVAYPEMRREVLRALAALSDVEYQDRVWVRKQYPTPRFFDDLTQNVTTLYDDCQVLPDPEGALTTVLVPGAELTRLRNLDRLLQPLLNEHGEAEDAAYMADARWPDVTKAAGLALAAMVLADGFNE